MSKSSYEPVNAVESGHEDLLRSIGERLEQIRVEKQISVTVLCAEVKMSRTTYYRMINGKVYFNTYKFLKILDVLEIPAIDFFKDIGNL
jgi:transcriptional regulator with XRE-family HTH domain